jgi:hypothetical protein
MVLVQHIGGGRKGADVMTQTWRDLAISTVRQPAEAAETVLSLQLGRDALWTALALISVVSTILFMASNFVARGTVNQIFYFDVPDENGTIVQLMWHITPIGYLAMVASGMILTIVALFWAGRFLSGTGSLRDMTLLIVWLHGLHLCALVAIFAMSLITPALATFFALCEAVVLIYVLLHFVNVGHGLGSLWKSFAVLVIMSVIAFVAVAIVTLFLGPDIGAPVNA